MDRINVYDSSGFFVGQASKPSGSRGPAAFRSPYTPGTRPVSIKELRNRGYQFSGSRTTPLEASGGDGYIDYSDTTERFY